MFSVGQSHYKLTQLSIHHSDLAKNLVCTCAPALLFVLGHGPCGLVFISSKGNHSVPLNIMFWWNVCPQWLSTSNVQSSFLKNPQILSYWKSTSTDAKSAREWVETNVRGVLQTSGKTWNVGVKIYLHLHLEKYGIWQEHLGKTRQNLIIYKGRHICLHSRIPGTFFRLWRPTPFVKTPTYCHSPTQPQLELGVTK